MSVCEIESDFEEIESPSSKLKRTKSLTRQQKSKSEFERDSIGYINDNFEFVVPTVDLTEYIEGYTLSFDKLNIFRALGLESPSNEIQDKKISNNIIQDIIQNEFGKYKNNPQLRRIVGKILGQDKYSN